MGRYGRETTAEDLVLVLLSGGASANLIAPASGISFEEKQATTRALLRSPIGRLRSEPGAAVAGDEVARGFLGIEPPTFLTLSMTRWIGIEPDPALLLDSVPETFVTSMLPEPTVDSVAS